jgi:hypothetical protein
MRMIVKVSPSGFFIAHGLSGALSREKSSLYENQRKFGLIPTASRINFFLNFGKGDLRDAKPKGQQLKNLRKKRLPLITATTQRALRELFSRIPKTEGLLTSYKKLLSKAESPV